MKTTKSALKEYSQSKQWQSELISVWVTFFSAFIVAIASLPIDPENFTRATAVALLLTWARAWIKAVVQIVLSKMS